MIDQILDSCDGTTCIADDISVCGKNDTDHNQHLHKFMNLSNDYGFILDSEKWCCKGNIIDISGCV